MFIVVTMPRTPQKQQHSRSSTPAVYQPPQVQGQGPSFGSSLKDGFGLGMGSAVAHNLVNRFMAPKPPSRDEICAGYKECLEVVGSKESCDRIFKACSETK